MLEVDKNEIRTIWRGWFIVFAGAFAVYWVSCAPGILWQDSGLIHWRVWRGDIVGRLGLALSHPLYYMVCIGVKNVSGADANYVRYVNLLSAFFGAAAVANLFWLVRFITRKTAAGILAAVTFGIGWTVWQHASVSESYMMYCAILAGELCVLAVYLTTRKRMYLYCLFFLNGLSVAVHMWGSLSAFCWAGMVVYLLFQRQVRLRDLLVMAGVWLAGASPYLWIVIDHAISTGDIAQTISSALFGNYYTGQVLNASLSWPLVKENLLFIGYNFATPTAILIIFGLITSCKIVGKVPGRLLLILCGIYFVFAFRYTVPDRYAFFIPFYMTASVFCGIGFAWLLGLNWRRKGLLKWSVLLLSFLPAVVYFVGPEIARRADLSVTSRVVVYRDEYNWFLQPWKTGYRGPEKFADAVFESVEGRSLIYVDSTIYWPLWYKQKFGQFSDDVAVTTGLYGDIPLTPVNIDELLDEYNLYVLTPKAGYVPGFLLSDHDFEQSGILRRVVKPDRQ
jgi:hypothetical protein